jgi:hypothetical protein
MPSNRTIKWGGGLIVLLIVANILNQMYWNWGLITVKVHDAPLSKVIKSIEWQGWVKIYTNLSPDTKVSMYVDHVPLAEAMETLATNVGGPPMGADRPRDGGGNGPGGTPPPASTGGAAPTPDTAANTNAPAGAPPAGPGGQGGPGGFAGGGPGGPPGGGPGGPGGRGGGRGGFGGGGFGGGATWNLGFFVAPTSAQVKAEIAAFQSGTTDDDTKVYAYPTPLQMLATDSDMPAADPRKQTWPGYKAPAPAPPPPVTPTTEAQPPPAPVDDGPPTVQTYLQAFAQGSNIWIMTPGSWAPEAHTPPPANSSIISAVKNFVSSSNGAVTQAIILRVGRGARGGGFAGGNRGGGGGFGDMSAMDDRMRNAINGLPADAQPQALDQLNQEIQFYQNVQAAAPEDRPKMVQEHMMQKMANGGPMDRMSPEKRASRMARSVTAREAVRGK